MTPTIAHVDGEVVRIVRNGKESETSKPDAAFLPEREPCQVVACPANYGLIVAMATLKSERTKPVTLVSPGLVGMHNSFSWETVFNCLRQRPVWRRLWSSERALASRDAVVYGVPSFLRQEPQDEYLVYHPAWTALSLLPGYSPVLACEFLAGFVDAHWFGHPTRRGRVSRLLRRLRIDPEGVDEALAPDGMAGLRSLKALVAMVFTDGYNREVLLRACRRAVQLIYHTWMGETCPVEGQSTFDPPSFFSDTKSILKYKARADETEKRRIEGGRVV